MDWLTLWTDVKNFWNFTGHDEFSLVFSLDTVTVRKYINDLETIGTQAENSFFSLISFKSSELNFFLICLTCYIIVINGLYVILIFYTMNFWNSDTY